MKPILEHQIEHSDLTPEQQERVRQAAALLEGTGFAVMPEVPDWAIKPVEFDGVRGNMSERCVIHEGKPIGRAWYTRGVWAFRSADGRFTGIAGSYAEASGELIQRYAETERMRKDSWTQSRTNP